MNADSRISPSVIHVDAIIRLSAAGLRATTVDAGSLAGLTAADWAAIHAMAHTQSIEALCFAGLPEEAAETMDAPTLSRWRRESDLTLYRQFAYDAERDTFLAQFAAHGLSWLTLKGIDMVAYYPQPGLRSMGDQDLVVAFVENKAADVTRTAEAESIMTDVMTGLGYTRNKDSERELGFVKDGLHVEFHRAMMSDMESANGFYSRDVLEHYRNPWSLAVSDDGRAYRLPPDEEYLFHVAHMWKHYNCTGFGLRFLADTIVLRERYRDVIDWAAMGETLDAMGMGGFERTVWSLSRTLFDHPEDWADRLGEREGEMLAEIMGGGTYGNADLLIAKQVQRRASAYRERSGGKTGRIGFLADYWMRRLLPDREWVRIYYPKLARLPLWPLFVGCARVGSALSHPGKIMREIDETLRRVGRDANRE
ncbi:nucleotidyltransferase domain-containing protein [Bifidobacterium samirii]|uniref:Nucleotidyltransferase family protein n=1 Tax=Bifidobacterium samirii TaxID=2306974 RepID=A0A430FVN8_9BIFI|nr:nucleotidyltransferase family protein [Bifidobacterium samirii]RSX58060.1 hypothetical protein D2E24_0420 [Bifidobacterium samirii]